MLFRRFLVITGLCFLPAVALQAQGLSSAASGDAGVPAGAVIAFATSSCPSGWSTYSAASGRSIVGTGYFSQRYRGQSYSKNYSLGETGGVRAYRFNDAETPNNRNSSKQAASNCDYSGCSGSGVSIPANSQTGYGSAHDNQDPYIALLYCRKN